MPRRSLAAECLRRRPCDLLGWHVAHALREAPLMAEGVFDLPVAVTPERIPERGKHLGPGADDPLPEPVHILGVDVEHHGRIAYALRRQDAHLWELVGHHHGRVADPELNAHQRTVGYWHAA